MITDNKKGAQLTSLRLSVLETVHAFAAHHQAHPDLALANVLAAVSCACQGLLDVAFPNGTVIPTSLITFAVAGSAEGKTPVQNMAFSAIKSFERSRRAGDLKAAEDHTTALEIWDIKAKALKAAVVKAIRNGENSASSDDALLNHLKIKPVRPRCIKLLYDDLTPSGLVIKLNEVWPFACINNADAADALLGKDFDNLTLFNKLADGDSIVRDRASAASFTLHDARLTINMAVQPESFRRFVERQGGFARNSGFLPRALVVLPGSVVGQRDQNLRANAFTPLAGLFDARITEMLQRMVSAVEAGHVRRTVATLSTQARARWIDFAQDCEDKSAPRGEFAEIKDHASKMPALVLRLAALLEYFEADSTTIQLTCLETAIRWGYSSLRAVRAIYQLGYTDAEQIELMDKMLEWLRRYTAGAAPVRRGDISANCPSVFRGKKGLIDQTLNHLVAAGAIFCIQGQRGEFYSTVPPVGYGVGISL